MRSNQALIWRNAEVLFWLFTDHTALGNPFATTDDQSNILWSPALYMCICIYIHNWHTCIYRTDIHCIYMTLSLYMFTCGCVCFEQIESGIHMYALCISVLFFVFLLILRWWSSISLFNQVWLLTKHEREKLKHPHIYFAICLNHVLKIWPLNNNNNKVLAFFFFKKSLNLWPKSSKNLLKMFFLQMATMHPQRLAISKRVQLMGLSYWNLGLKQFNQV